jgi:hypothetical protein
MSGWKPVDMDDEQIAEWLDRLPSDEIEVSEHGEGDFAVIAGRRIIGMQLDGQLYLARPDRFSEPLTRAGGKLQARVTRRRASSQACRYPGLPRLPDRRSSGLPDMRR